MGFTEEWFSPHSCATLAALVAEVEDVPGDIIEIGAWEGRSTVALAEATDRTIHSIDTWQGSPGEISADLAAGRDVYQTWQDNTAHLPNVVAHRMGWRDYTFRDPLALVFIDAEHTFQEVYDNTLTVLPRMSPGGIICGDDNHHPPVQAAIVAALPAQPVQFAASLWIYRHPR